MELTKYLKQGLSNGREKVNELRQSLDPEVELLCMLSPLQVIYALERKGKNMP
jgi:hypothetical protein